MSGGCDAIDDDDDLSKLMPNTAKLIRLVESDSLESKGSTSMSFSGNSVKVNVERQNPKPSRQRQGESVFREVANKFLRRGATGKRASKSSALATLSSNCRVGSPCMKRRRNTSVLEKENVRPKAPTLVEQGVRPLLKQKMTMRDVSQKVSRKFRKTPSRSERSSYFSVCSKIQRADKSHNVSGSEHLAEPAATIIVPKASRNSQGAEHFSKVAGKSERGKAQLYRTTMPLNLSELKEEFAEIDEETLEEEEVSIARMTRIAPVVTSETPLHHAHDILQNSVENRMDLSRSEREKVVSDIVKSKIEEAALPIYSHGQGQEGVDICTSQSMSSKTPGQDQDVQEPEPAGKGNDAVLSSGRDHNELTCPMKQLSSLDNHDLNDGNQRDYHKCQNEENPPLIQQDSASPFLKGLDDQARVGANDRTADTKTTPCQLEARILEMSGKVTSSCPEFELANAEGSCNHKRGCSPTKLNVDKPKVAAVDRPDEHGAHREGSVPCRSSTFRDVQSSPPKAKHLLDQEDVPVIPLQGGTARDTSATPPRLQYSRRWRIISMNQRRLAFESGSDSKQKAVARAVDSHSSDVSISTVDFKGRTNSAAGIINHDGHDFDANMTSVPDQVAKLALGDGEVIGQLDDRDPISHSPQPQAVKQIEGEVDKEKQVLAGFLAQVDNLPALEASGEMGKDPYCFNCPSPQARRATECLKIRRLGKRTWANLGAPIDGGREWKEGRRVSTRIKSRPLDWWRGERMLYGRVHSTLCTLIGIKTTSPDPVWPRPKPQRGDYAISNFHVDSFVDDSHCELLRLAAQ